MWVEGEHEERVDRKNGDCRLHYQHQQITEGRKWKILSCSQVEPKLAECAKDETTPTRTDIR